MFDWVLRLDCISPALAGVIAIAMTATAAGPHARAGGFAVHEQSTTLLGSAFAGSAAGIDLSSSFWNPAAFGIAPTGISTQSSITVILPDTELSNGIATISGFPSGLGGAASTSIDKVGVAGASYGAYRLNDKTVLGISVTSPFGLSSQADDLNWAGRFHGRAAEILTVNLAPSLAYEIVPGVNIAAGAQFEYAKLKLSTAAPLFNLPVQPTASIKLDDDAGVGYSAGILVNTGDRSNIGMGFRSSIRHDLSGSFDTPLGSSPASATFDTPEIVTLSAVQAVTPQVRVMGTVEWTNWSRIDRIPLTGIRGAVLDAQWKDGWLISGGAEFEYSQDLTLRGGVAWEKSPIRGTSSLEAVPDSDRFWVSMGTSYRFCKSTTVDFSYAHVFFADSHLTSKTLAPSSVVLNADVTNSADILSVGLRTRW